MKSTTYRIRIYEKAYTPGNFHFELVNTLDGFVRKDTAIFHAEGITTENRFCDVVEYTENGFRTVARTEEGRTFKF